MTRLAAAISAVCASLSGDFQPNIFVLERAAMVERQDIERAIVSSRHQAAPFSLR